MWFAIWALLLFSAFVFLLGYLFLSELLLIIINTALLYVVIARVIAEINLRKSARIYYAAGAVAAIPLAFFFWGYIPLWRITLFALFGFLAGKLFRIVSLKWKLVR